MPPTRNARDIFLAALDRAPADRAAYLDEACGDDADLRKRVEALLRANDEPGAFLSEAEPAGVVDATGTFGSPAEPTASHPGKGDHVGAILAGKYKLIEEIGEGGMGSVYMAQQTAPVKRAVAVKVIKAGMDSKAVLARFDAERQALALMDHPNIAKVLDAGATDGGRPFFVMELVKGTPITDFCDERRLTPRQRLELFVPVCQAIQHAHQKGVIHRDIKPSNVLVALYDDRPVPKVIDFGVAKAAGPALTDRTLMTGFGAIVGTPEYMSPEQANLNNLDIDTRSDVYSLGVLLYELLTGSTPVDRKSLGRAALLEVLRVVREVEAPRPSNKLSTSDALPSISANRGLEPKRLTKQVRGELDWIVMKSLEKDRARRYETANGFAADVQRYLAGEQVQAVPPSAGYRLRKFLRKHRGPVAAAGVVLLALVAGVVGTSWGLVEARHQRDDAEYARGQEAEQRAKVEEREKSLGEKTRLLEEQKKEAEDARRDADLELHDNQRLLLREAWEAGETPKLRAILDQMRPRPGKDDRRGFETHYLDRLVHAEVDRVAYDPPAGRDMAMDFFVPGRVLYQCKRAANAHYATVTATDLATGKPLDGLTPIQLRSDEEMWFEASVTPGSSPRLWTEAKSLDMDPALAPETVGLAIRNIGVWDARTGRRLAGCDELFPDPELVKQGWRQRPLRLNLTNWTNGAGTRFITQLVKEVAGADGKPAGVEARAQVHDLATGKTVCTLDPGPG